MKWKGIIPFTGPVLTCRSIRYLVLLLLAKSFCARPSMAQEHNELPLFTITLSNGRFFTPAELPKGKPVLLIYFAPDCDHCHTLMNEFFRKAAAFKSAEVVMVTFKPVSDVRSFEQAYQTALFANIRVGTEGSSNYLRMYYRLQSTPFVALYNGKGQLVTSYRKDVPVERLIESLKKL